MIIIVFGLPGSGKSYFARRLAIELNALYYSTDTIRKELNKNPSYDLNARLNIYNYLLDKIESKKTMVLDGTFYKQDIREKFNAKINLLGEKVIYIEIIAEEALIKKRTSIVREDSDADFFIYKKIKEQFEPMNDAHLILQSTDSNIDEMLRDSIHYLNSKI